MSSRFATRGLALARTHSYRQKVQRRRIAVVCAIAGLAIASGLIGSLVRPASRPTAVAADTGPFSYFPR